MAKILAQGANILLLDEAFSGVDIGSQISLIEVLRKLKDSGKTIMIATHDINNIADRFDEECYVSIGIVAHTEIH